MTLGDIGHRPQGFRRGGDCRSARHHLEVVPKARRPQIRWIVRTSSPGQTANRQRNRGTDRSDGRRKSILGYDQIVGALANLIIKSPGFHPSLLTCLRQSVILKAIVRDSSTTGIVATLWRILPRPRSAPFVELLSSRLKRATHPTSVECQRPHRCPKIENCYEGHLEIRISMLYTTGWA
jgi:hypothetical protein